MAFDFLGKLKPRSSSVPESIHIPAGMGPGVLTPPEQKQKKIDMATYIMSLNRKERRNFMKQSGIKVPGSAKPFINTHKKK